MPDLYWMQKVRNIKLDNDDNDVGEVILINIGMNFKETCYMCGKECHRKQIFNKPANGSKVSSFTLLVGK